MNIPLIFLTTISVFFFNPALAIGGDKLVYAYGEDKLFEISNGKFVLADGAGNRSKIAFVGKSPYSFSEIDKEAVQSGMAYYGRLVANCGGSYYKYNGWEKEIGTERLRIVQGKI